MAFLIYGQLVLLYSHSFLDTMALFREQNPMIAIFTTVKLFLKMSRMIHFATEKIPSFAKQF